MSDVERVEWADLGPHNGRVARSLAASNAVAELDVEYLQRRATMVAERDRLAAEVRSSADSMCKKHGLDPSKGDNIDEITGAITRAPKAIP